MPVHYFSNPGAAFNSTPNRVLLQKSYALFFVDFQQWIEYRHTGLPNLPNYTGMTYRQRMPSRLV